MLSTRAPVDASQCGKLIVTHHLPQQTALTTTEVMPLSTVHSTAPAPFSWEVRRMHDDIK